ncbi:DUF397 domain-containing protein [Streptomyces griseoviridis]|jgi:hypothetical protein|uniref:DUF397 domain-containing protein n=1 Tax=Streptomyces griseoviridis TaxID=45398 RepID=A0ABT9LGM5_STRGD|nr:DUF397 domain-containing protein [Streptomyces griseoviridis]MDP9681892.1 hypothetical protein [Streptomyces griseoviridis]GGT04064.1 hypothetical protein GCM10010240_41890 [Streptomyces griseoviridis]
MGIPDTWWKSSYSGPGDGDSCVEVARRPTRISVRDSKTPQTAALTFATPSFTAFIEALKAADPGR